MQRTLQIGEQALRLALAVAALALAAQAAAPRHAGPKPGVVMEW